jgi:hypothetical protein
MGWLSKKIELVAQLRVGNLPFAGGSNLWNHQQEGYSSEK